MKKEVAVAPAPLGRSASTIEASRRDSAVSATAKAVRSRSSTGTLQSGIGKSRVRNVTTSVDLSQSDLRPSTSPGRTEFNRASARESFIYASAESLRRVQSPYELSTSPEESEEKGASRDSVTLLEFITQGTATFDNSVDIGVTQDVVLPVVNEPVRELVKDNEFMMSRAISNASSSKKSIEAVRGTPVPQQIPEVPQLPTGGNQEKAKKGSWVSSFAKRVWGVRSRS